MRSDQISVQPLHDSRQERTIPIEWLWCDLHTPVVRTRIRLGSARLLLLAADISHDELDGMPDSIVLELDLLHEDLLLHTDTKWSRQSVEEVSELSLG